MNDPRDYKLDLSPAAAAAEIAAAPPVKPAGLVRPSPTAPAAARPFLGVHFRCCNVYARVYRNLNGREYLGRCPRCGAKVRFAVGAGGSDSRSFVVE